MRSYRANPGLALYASQGTLTTLGGFRPTRVSGRLARAVGDLIQEGREVSCESLGAAADVPSKDACAFLEGCVSRGVLVAVAGEHSQSSMPWSAVEFERICRLETDETLPVETCLDEVAVVVDANSADFEASVERGMLRTLLDRDADLGKEGNRPRWIIGQVNLGADLRAKLIEWRESGAESVLPVVVAGHSFTVGPWVDSRTQCLACLSTRLTEKIESSESPSYPPMSDTAALLAAAQAEIQTIRRSRDGSLLFGQKYEFHDLTEWTSTSEVAFDSACDECAQQAGAAATSTGDRYLQTLEVDGRIALRPTPKQRDVEEWSPNDVKDCMARVLNPAKDRELDEQLGLTVGSLASAAATERAIPDVDSIAEVIRLGVGFRQLPETRLLGGPKRWAPSAGNFGSPEIYGLCWGSYSGIPEVFHYDKARHGLAALRDEVVSEVGGTLASVDLGTGTPRGDMTLVLCFDLARLSRKYDRGYQLGHLDCGVVLTHLRLAARRQGWVLSARPNWNERTIARVLRLDRSLDVIAAVAQLSFSPGGEE